MAEAERKIVYDGGQLFRVEHQPVDGRELPYEFVRRVGATTVLATTNIEGEPHVLGIRNTRAFYGASTGLPGGNANGRFSKPENPTVTGLRELREKTGYGYPRTMQPNVDTFLMRPVSTGILYDRFFSVARGVRYRGGEMNSAHEIVEVQPVPIAEYLAPLMRMDRGELYPEINLAFARAAQKFGPELVIDWTQNGNRCEAAADIVQSFEPWMSPIRE